MATITQEGQVSVAIKSVLTSTAAKVTYRHKNASVGDPFRKLEDLINFTRTFKLTNGAGKDQANEVWYDEKILAATTADVTDLSGGITDAHGNSIVFTKVRGLLIYSDEDNPSTLRLRARTALQADGWLTWCAAAEDAVKIQPGGLLLLMAPNVTGYAVIAATADKVDIYNDGASAAKYTIVVFGSV